MEREDIKKQARKQLKGIVPCEWNQQPFIEIFVDAAEWRINSVWHDANEIIIKPGFILLEIKKKHGKCYNIWRIKSSDAVSYWDEFMKDNNIIRYAYIEDLLP